MRFWTAIGRGASSEDAACEIGSVAGGRDPLVSRGWRGGSDSPPAVSGRFLSFAEREDIAIWHARLTEVIEHLLAPYEEQAGPGRIHARLGTPLRPGRRRRDRGRHDQVPHRRPPVLLGRKDPLDHESGKRAGRARHKEGNKYLGAITGETAVAAGKTATREGARYRKLARSRGKGKAQVAVGNTQLRVYHKLLSNPGMRHQDLGPDYYERQAAVRRKIAYHVREIEALGLEVTIARIPEPDPDPATTQAA